MASSSVPSTGQANHVRFVAGKNHPVSPAGGDQGPGSQRFRIHRATISCGSHRDRRKERGFTATALNPRRRARESRGTGSTRARWCAPAEIPPGLRHDDAGRWGRSRRLSNKGQAGNPAPAVRAHEGGDRQAAGRVDARLLQRPPDDAAACLALAAAITIAVEKRSPTAEASSYGGGRYGAGLRTSVATSSGRIHARQARACRPRIERLLGIYVLP